MNTCSLDVCVAFVNVIKFYCYRVVYFKVVSDDVFKIILDCVNMNCYSLLLHHFVEDLSSSGLPNYSFDLYHDDDDDVNFDKFSSFSYVVLVKNDESKNRVKLVSVDNFRSEIASSSSRKVKEYDTVLDYLFVSGMKKLSEFQVRMLYKSFEDSGYYDTVIDFRCYYMVLKHLKMVNDNWISN